MSRPALKPAREAREKVTGSLFGSNANIISAPSGLDFNNALQT